MRIEKIYYSESIAACEARKKELWEQIRGEMDMLQGLSEEEAKAREEKAIDDMVRKMLPPEEQCVTFDPRKYDLFVVLAKFSVSIAREMIANLLVYTEDGSG